MPFKREGIEGKIESQCYLPTGYLLNPLDGTTRVDTVHTHIGSQPSPWLYVLNLSTVACSDIDGYTLCAVRSQILHPSHLL